MSRIEVGVCYMGWGVMAIVMFVIKKFARLAVDIRLIRLIAMPVLGYSSTDK